MILSNQCSESSRISRVRDRNDASVEEAFYKMKEAHNLLIKDLDNVRK